MPLKETGQSVPVLCVRKRASRPVRPLGSIYESNNRSQVAPRRSRSTEIFFHTYNPSTLKPKRCESHCAPYGLGNDEVGGAAACEETIPSSPPAPKMRKHGREVAACRPSAPCCARTRRCPRKRVSASKQPSVESNRRRRPVGYSKLIRSHAFAPSGDVILLKPQSRRINCLRDSSRARTG